MEEAQSQQQPARGGSWMILLVVLVIGGSAAGAFIYQMMQGSRKPKLDATGFDIAQTTESKPVVLDGGQAPKIQSSLMGVTGVIPGMRIPGSAPKSQTDGLKMAPTAPAQTQLDDEQAFLRRYGRALQAYQVRLSRITTKYYKSSAAVRDVDRSFAQMPRYMAIKKRYDTQDANPFAFARDAIALPEVRAEISKRMKDPEVWKAALGMITETLKETPPPPEVYQAAAKFMTTDPSMSKYMGEFTGEAKQHMNEAIAAIPLGTDTSQLTKIVHDVGADQAAAAAPVSGAPVR